MGWSVGFRYKGRNGLGRVYIAVNLGYLEELSVGVKGTAQGPT